MVGQLRKEFESGRTKTVEWRRTQLEQMLKMVDEKKEAMFEAVYKDLGKVRCLLLFSGPIRSDDQPSVRTSYQSSPFIAISCVPCYSLHAFSHPFRDVATV